MGRHTVKSLPKGIDIFFQGGIILCRYDMKYRRPFMTKMSEKQRENITYLL